MEKVSKNAAGYSMYFIMGPVRRTRYFAKYKVTGKDSTPHSSAGFHQSIIVRLWKAIDAPEAAITVRVKMIIRIISKVLLFKALNSYFPLYKITNFN